jgi:predicted DNA-binding protein (MmcQ/YjbR family)
MKAWSAALAAETADWPQVATRPFFGFSALYRRDRIFALLPRTRALETSNSLAFKLESAGSRTLTRLQQDSRVGATEMRKARWFTLALTSAADLRDALEWIRQAYQAAGSASSKVDSR